MAATPPGYEQPRRRVVWAGLLNEKTALVATAYTTPRQVFLLSPWHEGHTAGVVVFVAIIPERHKMVLDQWNECALSVQAGVVVGVVDDSALNDCVLISHLVKTNDDAIVSFEPAAIHPDL